ncbi:hypothetical protein C2G38_2189659 [Gigaspora rosea]|uniref:Uncharacterized protein n=1 Tax=Gigaspora rosea TaxID=44941 RepID=A0A397V995_9GLOM|nr:hypothetical protein C2G38_2189659 [Gigaspora rosea]
MKKALNIALDLGAPITQFNQLENITVNDPLVTKHHGQPPTKRLKSSSETQDYTGLTHSNHAINPQDPNLRIPLSNISSNNSTTIEKSKRKYVYNIRGEVGHNARACRQK